MFKPVMERDLDIFGDKLLNSSERYNPERLCDFKVWLKLQELTSQMIFSKMYVLSSIPWQSENMTVEYEIQHLV